MLKLKDGIEPKILEKYGFELGQTFVDKGERCIVKIQDVVQHKIQDVEP